MAKVEKQPFDIPFLSGISEDVPEKLLPPERLLLVENGDINKRGVIRKARSFLQTSPIDIAGPSLIGPLIRKLARLKDQLVMFDQSTRKAYNYLPTTGLWGEVGDHTPCRITDEEIDGTAVDSFVSAGSPSFLDGDDLHTAFVEKNGYYVAVHGDKWYVLDKSNLSIVSRGVLPGGGPKGVQFIRAVGIPQSNRVVVIAGGTTALDGHFFDLTQPGNGLISSVVLDSLADPSQASFDAFPCLHDNKAEFVVTWRRLNLGIYAVFTRAFDDTGSPASNLLQVSSGTATLKDHSFICSAGLSSGAWIDYWVFWADVTTGDWQRTVVRYATGGALIAIQIAQASMGFGSITPPIIPVPIFAEGNGSTAYQTGPFNCQFLAGEGLGSDFPLQPGGHSVLALVNNAGIVTQPTVFQNRGMDIMSKIFTYDGEQYFIGVIGTDQRVQNTYFLMRLNGVGARATVVGRFLVGRARVNQGGDGSATEYFGRQITEVIEEPSVPGRFKCLLPKAGADFVSAGFASAVYGSAIVTIDFNETGNAAVIGDTLFVVDGTLWAYDGQSLAEAGFHAFAEKLESVVLGGTGVLSAGVYQAVAVYVWYDSYGRVYRSAPTPLPVTGTAVGGDYWQVKIPTLQISSKNGVKIEVYRTTANSAVPGFYLEKVFDNDPTGALQGEIVPTYLGDTGVPNSQDGLNDTDLVNQPQLYTDSGELDHIAPPAATSIAVHGNRLWLITDNALYYSKTWREGAGIQFNDGQRELVDPKGGRLVGVASLGEQLLIGKEERLLRMYGDGPNDLGTGVFSRPLEITTDIGVRFGTPMLEWQHGVVLQSEKGVWNVNRDFSQMDIGRSILDLGKLPVVSAITSTNKDEFWLLAQDALEAVLLTFDWHAEQWTSRRLTFQSSPTGAFALYENDLFIIDDAGNLYRESDAVHDTTRIKTGFFRPGGIDGFHRLWWIYIHMKWLAPHTINVRLTYEDGSTEEFSKEFLRADEPQIVRIKPGRQKETGYQIEVWDSDFTENCCEWYGMTLVAGVKPQRLPVSRGKNIGSE